MNSAGIFSDQGNRIYTTPWQKKGIGKEECLRLSLDPNNIVHLEVLSKGTPGSFFSKLFSKNADDTNTPVKVIRAKNFTAISAEKFEQEKQKLGSLVEAHATIKEMLQTLDSDLQNSAPTSSSKELIKKEEATTPKDDSFIADLKKQLDELKKMVAQLLPGHRTETAQPTIEILPQKTIPPENEAEKRQTTITDLRSKLSSLLSTIESTMESEESKDRLQEFKNFESTVQRVKSAAYEALKKLNTLEEKPDSSEMDSRELQTLKLNSERWTTDVESVRQALVRETSMREEADSVTSQLKSYSPQIQAEWKKKLDVWLADANKDVASPEQMKTRSKAFDQLIESIGTSCKKDAIQLITAAKLKLQETIENSFSDDYLDGNKTSLDHFKELILAARLKAWETIEKENIPFELEAISQWKKSILKAQSLDDTLLETLARPSIETWFVYAKKRTWDFINYILPPPSDPISLMAALDDVAAEHLYALLDDIRVSSKSLLNSVSTPDSIAFNPLFEKLSKKKGVTQGEIQELITNVLSASNAWLESNENNLKAAEIRTRKEKIESLYDSFVTLLDCQKDSRKHFLTALTDKQKKLSQKGHPSLGETSKPLLEKIQKQLPWDPQTDLGTLSAAWKQWRIDARGCESAVDNLDKLAPLQDEYLKKFLVKADSDFPKMTGEEKIAAEEEIAALRDILDIKNVMQGETIDKYFVETCQRMYQDQANSIQQLFNREDKKKKLRKKIVQEINSYIVTLGEFRKKIGDVEKTHSIKLPGLYVTLEENETEMRQWETEGTLPRSYLSYVPYWGHSSTEVKLAELSLDDLPQYFESVSTEVAEKKKLLKKSPIQKIHEEHKKFTKETAAITARIKELEKSREYWHADRLEVKLKELQEEQKKNLSGQHANTSALIKSLKDGTEAQTTLLKEYGSKLKSLKLLVQMKRFANEGNREKENIVRKAFIKDVHEKISDYQSLLSSTLARLDKYPKLHAEANEIAQEFWRDFEPYLNIYSSNKGDLAYYSSYLLKPFIATENLSVDELDAKRLSDYSRAIDSLIDKGNAKLDLLSKAQEKASAAHETYTRTIESVKDKLKELDKKNQLTYKAELQEVLENVQELKAKDIDGLGVFWGFVEKVKNMPSNALQSLGFYPPLLVSADHYTKRVGYWVGQLQSGLNEIEKKETLSISQQLRIVPTDEMAQELRERHAAKVSAELEPLKRELESKQNFLKTLATYVPTTTKLFGEISDAVSSKLAEVDSLKKELTNKGWLWGHSTIKIDDFTANNVDAHDIAVKEAIQNFEKDLEKKFYLQKIKNGHSQFTEKLKEAKKRIERLEKKSVPQHFYAYALKLKIEKLEEKSKQLHSKFKSTEALISLPSSLQQLAIDIQAEVAASENNDKISLNGRQQLEQFVKNAKENTAFKKFDTTAFKKFDTSVLKKMVAEDVSKTLATYESDLDKFESNLHKLCDEFEIPPSLSQNMLKEVQRQKAALSSEQFSAADETFLVENGGWRGFLGWKKNKKIEDMTDDEILKVKPDATVDAFTKKAMSTIKAKSFGTLVKQYEEYTTVLKRAKEYRDQLKQDKQLYTSIVLKKEIESIENKVKGWNKDHSIRRMEQFGELNEALQTFCRGLRNAEATAKGTPTYSLKAQYQMMKNTSDSDQIKELFIADIQEDIVKQEKEINTFTNNIVELGKTISLPIAWQEGIFTELNKCRENLNNYSKGVEVVKNNWFRSQRKTIQFEELSFEELDQSKINIEKISQTLHNVNVRYSISRLESKSKAYIQSIEEARELEKSQRKSLQLPYADTLKSSIKNAEKELADFYNDPTVLASAETAVGAPRTTLRNGLPVPADVLANHHASDEVDYSTGLDKLSLKLDKLTQELTREVQKARNAKKLHFRDLVSGVLPNTPEFFNLFTSTIQHLKEELAKRLSDLDDYRNVIGKFSKALQEMTEGRGIISHEWQQDVFKEINTLQDKLELYQQGIPLNVGEQIRSQQEMLEPYIKQLELMEAQASVAPPIKSPRQGFPVPEDRNETRNIRTIQEQKRKINLGLKKLPGSLDVFKELKRQNELLEPFMADVALAVLKSGQDQLNSFKNYLETNFPNVQKEIQLKPELFDKYINDKDLTINAFKELKQQLDKIKIYEDILDPVEIRKVKSEEEKLKPYLYDLPINVLQQIYKQQMQFEALLSEKAPASRTAEVLINIDSLDLQQLTQFEKQIRDLVDTKNANGLENSNCTTILIESKTGVKALEGRLNSFKEALEKSRKHIKSTDSYDKKEQKNSLQLLQDMQIELVNRAFQNLKSLASVLNCNTSISTASTTLFLGNNAFADGRPIPFDAWTNMKKLQQDYPEDYAEREEFKNLKKDLLEGYELKYKDKEKEFGVYKEVDRSVPRKGIVQNLDLTRKWIESTRDWLLELKESINVPAGEGLIIEEIVEDGGAASINRVNDSRPQNPPPDAMGLGPGLKSFFSEEESHANKPKVPLDPVECASKIDGILQVIQNLMINERKTFEKLSKEGMPVKLGGDVETTVTFEQMNSLTKLLDYRDVAQQACFSWRTQIEEAFNNHGMKYSKTLKSQIEDIKWE